MTINIARMLDEYEHTDCPDYAAGLDAEEKVFHTEPMSRDEYEAQCAETGTRMLDDRTIRFSDDWPYYPPSDRQGFLLVQLAKCRQLGIQAERAATPRAATPEPRMGQCRVCHQTMATSSLMNSSRGTVCPGCYDAASD